MLMNYIIPVLNCLLCFSMKFHFSVKYNYYNNFKISIVNIYLNDI